MLADQPSPPPRKRGPKPSGRRSRTLGVRLYDEEVAALQKMLAENMQPGASLSGLGAALIIEGLERNGLLPISS